MQFVEKAINEYLDAVTATHGADFRARTVVESRGGTQILLKSPEHQEAMLINLGTLELMTKHLNSGAEQAA